MRYKRLGPAVLGLAVWGSAGVAAAAPGDPWTPKSPLFHLNYRYTGIALLVAAVGIALGIIGTKWFQSKRGLIPGTQIVRRHSPGHMLAHWTNAIGFLLALFTGAVMLKWIKLPIDKVPLYTLHYVGAGLILLGFVSTAVNATTQGTSTVHHLIPRGHQVREAFIELLSYAGLVGDRGFLGFKALQLPVEWRRGMEKAVGFDGLGHDGKYLAAEEVLSYPFWSLVGLAILSTGILKAARYGYHLAPSVVKWITIIHDWAAIGTVVMLCVHVGALILVRTNWPLLASMFTGKVSLEYVRQNHHRWYEEITADADKGPSTARKPVVTSRTDPAHRRS